MTHNTKLQQRVPRKQRDFVIRAKKLVERHNKTAKPVHQFTGCAVEAAKFAMKSLLDARATGVAMEPHVTAGHAAIVDLGGS